MDAQGRGGAGDIDPADQWVFNPRTGNYELRLPGAQQARPPHSRSAGANPTTHATGTAPRQRRAEPAGRASEEATPGSRPPPGSGDGGDRSDRNGEGDGTVPVQRDRRASGGSRRKGRNKKQRGRGKKALMWVGGSLALLLVIGAGTAYYLYWRLNNNITSIDVGSDNHARAGEPVNILFLGTDMRIGEGNEDYGEVGNEGRADTMILLHFSEDRSHATGLSLPRDLITDIPDCEVRRDDGSTEVIPGQQGSRLSYSLGVDGRDPGCAWRTVEELTGLEINHFMMADFNAVKSLSSAVGGVEVCLEEPIDDPKSHLQLDAGRHRIEGEEALAFVRTRYNVGLGSDLSRIELQQQFLGSLAREINSSNTLTNPSKLWDLADTATSALTVDSGIGKIERLVGLAEDLGQVPVSDISFVTLPVVDNPDEPEDAKATVVLDEAKAQPLFNMLREDRSLTEEKQDDGDGGDGDAEEEPEMAAPEDVRVDVFNGGDVIGAAQETVSWLQNEHGVVLSTNAGNAAEHQEATTLVHGPDQADQAARLADLMGLPKSALQEQGADAGDQPMVLTLGNDFTAAGQPIEVPDQGPPEDVDSIQADDEDVCAS